MRSRFLLSEASRIARLKPGVSDLLLLTFSFLLSPFSLSSQSVKTLRITGDTIRIDTLSLVPGSWKVMKMDNTVVPDSLYRVDWLNALLIWKGDIRPSQDSVRVAYESFPIRLNKVYQHKDLNYNRIDKPVYRPPGIESMYDRSGGSGTSALRSNGSLSRGLSLGNKRDASLTSNLNLQMEGNLNRDFRIEATLTDANIPVQPEGNTQQIQEFDKVFIRIYNPKNEILAGDFDIRPADGYFLRMNKRVQGARYTTETKSKEGKAAFRTSTGAAVVKGKWARNAIQGQEGNQGPYVLTGASGESYIQVIAGSEKVYIDGRPLVRGEEADYVIDYNTAELRFTPKILITKDKRIQVEFEYTERSYARFLLFNENRWTTSGGAYYINLYSENDAKNQPVLQDLTDSGKELLTNIGDQESLARMSAIRESVFQNDRVMYKLTDTLVNGIRYDSILVQSFHPDSALYEARFTFTGTGKGHYQPAQSAANGRVFEWVAPEDGKLQGSYEPVTRLVMPQSKQVFTAGMQQALGRRMSLGMEWAITRNDRNTFSAKDDQDNFGMGMKTNLLRKDYLKRDSTLALESYLNYRFTGSRFDPVERYREIEFERDWNVTDATDRSEHLLESGFRLVSRDSLSALYRMQYLNRLGGNVGFRQLTEGRIIRKSWETGWNGSYLLSSDSFRDTRFLRHTAYYRQQIGNVRLEVSENAENNRWQAAGTDTLMSNSAGFQEFRIEALQKRGERQPWVVRLSERTDLLPSAGRLRPAGRALEAESWFDIARNPSLPLRAGFHFRTLRTDSTQSTTDDGGQNLTARIDGRWKAFKGLIQSQTFFEIGSGFDRKTEYSYLEVAAGQGYYTWNDYNNNNIKELDEFEASNFRDQATYIRVFRLGTELMPILVNRFNQVFTIQPLKGVLSKFTSQLAYRIDKKTTRDDFIGFLNPFTINPADQSMISLNSQLRHTLSFNRVNPKFNADLVTQKQSTRTTLINGAEGKVNWSNSLLIRYRFHPAWQLNATTDLSTRKSISEFFSTRNYFIESLSQLVRIECEASDKLRISLNEEVRSEKNNTDATKLFANCVEGILTWQIPDKGQVSLSVQHVYIRYNGATSSPSGYAMMRGFSNGHNGVAQLSARYKLGKNLVLEAMYEGRITGSGKPVHNAQLQVKAVF
ncbi:MAG: hypothetical protein V2A67_07775 [Bacteroidota bacterium]